MSFRSLSTSYPSHRRLTTPTSRPDTSRTGTARSSTRARTATSALGGSGDQQIICAITESRGMSPTVGLAFVNLSTAEAVLCQISDHQTYARTLHKVSVFEPTEILFASTNVHPQKSTLFQIIESNLHDAPIAVVDRKYWSDVTGVEYIQQLAFKEDVEAIKVSIGGNFYATCCLSACLKYVELNLGVSFPFHSMRIRYEGSEGSMMIDLSTIHSLELIQNLHNVKSKNCLFGLLNQTMTPMGSRLLRGNILQPSTDENVLIKRYDALEELARHEELFLATRQALKHFLDVERLLTSVILIPSKPTIQHQEQSINNVILLKQYIKTIPSIFEALDGARSSLLIEVGQLCAPEMFMDVSNLIDEAINPDTTYQSKPLDLRNQRTYAVKSGVNGLLDVARQTYKESNADASQLVDVLSETHNLSLFLKYDTGRQYYIQLPASELEDRNLPEIFVNVFRKKKFIECQTLDLVKLNQKIMDSHHEVQQMSDHVVQTLIDSIRQDVAPLFKISEAIAMLDMLASFAQTATTQDYIRPELISTLAIKAGRHPMREKIQADRFVPNDVYATQQTRFQIITGCNMSGKSTYTRSIALMSIMAQIGCFVPATYASFPIRHQLFARVSLEENVEANASTFSTEMREMAFILKNIDPRSLVIVDELGRGTSTVDGLAIAIAIAEALIESRALVWFVTHFRDLARFLAERPGVVNLHLTVQMSEADRMVMLYRIGEGYVQEQHYGIALAKVMNLPPGVIDVAEVVSKKLAANNERRKKNSLAVIQARKRRLILGLREQLQQAKEGNMNGEVLRAWLKRLQDEFVIRMDQLEQDVRAAEHDEDMDNNNEDGNGGGKDEDDNHTLYSSSDETVAETYGRAEYRPRGEPVMGPDSMDVDGVNTDSEFTRLRGRSMSTDLSVRHEGEGESGGFYMSGALQG